LEIELDKLNEDNKYNKKKIQDKTYKNLIKDLESNLNLKSDKVSLLKEKRDILKNRLNKEKS